MDDLKSTLKNSTTDSAACEAYISLSYFYTGDNSDSAFFYASLAESKLKKIPPSLQCSVYKLLGILNSTEGKNDEALKYFLTQLKIAETYSLFSQSTSANICMANVFEELNEKEKALTYFSNALFESKKSKDSLLIDATLADCADFYFNNRHYDKAQSFWQQRLLYRPSLKNDERYISYSGDIFMSSENYSLAESYYQRAIELAEYHKNLRTLIVLYNNFASIEYKKGLDEAAITYYKKSREIALKNHYASEAGFVNKALANILYKSKKYRDALPYLDEALAYYQSNNMIRDLKELYELRADVFVSIGDYKNAYESLKKSGEYNEQLLNYDSQSKIAKLQESIETGKLAQKKNKELEEQKRTTEKQRR